MEILNQILPFSVSIITLIIGWWGGRRKSTAEVENIKADHAEKILKLNDEYLIAPLTKKIDNLSQKNTAIRTGIEPYFRLLRQRKLSG